MPIDGPLHTEAMGPVDAPVMVLVHPNPMDGSCWAFQMAHFSTWFRCVAVDLPGYGRSPRSSGRLSMREVAEACWSAVDAAGGPVGEGGRGAVLVGCSVGATVVEHMYHLRPGATRALVLSGIGYRPGPVKVFAPPRIAAFREHGIGYRYDYTLELFGPDFAGTPLAAWFARLFTERNHLADVDTIVAMFEALGEEDPDWLFADLHAPVLLVSGTEDKAHQSAFELRDRLPDVQMVTMPGAGHACFVEQPWVFDELVLDFLRARELLPAA